MAAAVLYLGTTPADLQSARRDARQLLEATGYTVLEREPLPSESASGEEAEAKVRTALGQCSGVILLVGVMHGPDSFHATAAAPPSCSELEYRIAQELGIPCYTYLLDEEFPYEDGAVEPPSKQAAQCRFRVELQAQPRGWESVDTPERLMARLRLVTFRLEDLRLFWAEPATITRATSTTIVTAPVRVSSPPPFSPPPLPGTGSAEPRTAPSPNLAVPPPVPAGFRRSSGVVLASFGIVAMAAALGIMVWHGISHPDRRLPQPGTLAQPASSTPSEAPAPAPAPSAPVEDPPADHAVTSTPRDAPAPAPPPGGGALGPVPAKPSDSTSPRPTVPVVQLPPIGGPLDPAPPTPVKATVEPLTEESRAQLVLTRRLLMHLADLQASLFFPMEPLTLSERRQVAMQRLAEHEHTTVDELEERFFAFASGPASAPQAPTLDRALASYVTHDFRGAACAAAEAARELSGDPDELRATLLLQAHALHFNRDSQGAFTIYEKVMKETTGTRQPAEWALATSMVAMLSSATKNDYKPTELMMRVLANEEHHHGKESYAVARTLRQIAHHLPNRDDLDELRESTLGRASKIHEKLDPERSTPEVARIYIAFAKGRDARPANESDARSPNPTAKSKKTRKSGFRNDAYYAGAIKIDERHFGPDSPTVADDLMEQGRDLTLALRFAEAEPPLRRALAILNKQKGSKHQDTVNAQTHLGRMLRESGRFDEAETVLLSALANQKECPEDITFYLGLRHHELALLYLTAGKDQAYEKTLRAGIAAGKDEGWPDVFPQHMMIEGLILHLEKNQRDLEAVPFIIRRVNIMEKLGEISPDEVALSIGKAANTLSNTLDNDPDAELLFKRALKAGAEVPPPMAAVHVVNLRRYADYLISLKRIEEAEKHLREAVKLDEQVPSHKEKGSAALLLGAVLMSHGDPKEAITHLKAALPMIIRLHGELHPDALWGYYCLSSSYLLADRPREAEPLLRKTIALMDKATEKDPVVYASTVLAHGMSLMDLDRLGDAEPVLRRSVKLEYAAHQEEGDDSGNENAANYYRDVLTLIYGLTEEEAEERILDIRAGKSVPKLEVRKPAKVPRPKLTA